MAIAQLLTLINETKQQQAPPAAEKEEAKQ
jgi:hypothetical protein